jgi:cytidylate kinase
VAGKSIIQSIVSAGANQIVFTCSNNIFRERARENKMDLIWNKKKSSEYESTNKFVKRDFSSENTKKKIVNDFLGFAIAHQESFV